MKINTTYEMNNDTPEERKRSIRNMFDAIVPTYDLLNRLLSFGIDRFWRKHIFRYLKDVKGCRVIDLCCGTGDLSLLLHEKGAMVTSLDFSLKMLQKGLARGTLKHGALVADACHIPVKDNTFTVATIAFGIRNIPDLDNFLGEVRRVLAPGGQLAILELVRPEIKWVRSLLSFYLTTWLPFIGGLISGKPGAYKYLSGTIASFVSHADLSIILERNGFVRNAHFPQTLNVATIMISEKEGPY